MKCDTIIVCQLWHLNSKHLLVTVVTLLIKGTAKQQYKQEINS